MHHLVADIAVGEKKWMCLPYLHKERPLLVTFGELLELEHPSMEAPLRCISVERRDGMLIDDNHVLYKPLSQRVPAKRDCYDTEEEAQKAIDDGDGYSCLERAELRKLYENEALEYLRNNQIEFSEDSIRNMYICGFVDGAMNMRYNRDKLMNL